MSIAPRQLDPGWLFLAAGLALCAAGLLVPVQRDLEAMRLQVRQLAFEKERSIRRLDAHRHFLRQLERREPSLVRRLAASQLNVVPAGTTPLLAASTRDVPVTEWISRSVAIGVGPATATPAPETWLVRLTAGGYRLWVLGAGVFAIFLGLIIGADGGRGKRGRDVVPRWRRDQFRAQGEELVGDVAYPELADFQGYQSYDE